MKEYMNQKIETVGFKQYLLLICQMEYVSKE